MVYGYPLGVHIELCYVNCRMLIMLLSTSPFSLGKHCENTFQYCVDENPCQNEGVCVMQNPGGFK